MKGNNSMYICPSQMIEMVQSYFDEHLFAKGQSPKISGIVADATNGGFRITLAADTPTVETATKTNPKG